MSDARAATLYRMVLPEHICPHGVHAKELLEAASYSVNDQPLTTREEVEAFKEKEDVETTPVTFIDGTRYPTSEALAEFLEASAAE